MWGSSSSDEDATDDDAGAFPIAFSISAALIALIELLPSLCGDEAVVEGVFVDGVELAGVVGVGKAAVWQEPPVVDVVVGLISLTPSKAAFRAASTAFSAASPGVDGALPPLRISRAIS